jgi:hypothetical protein
VRAGLHHRFIFRSHRGADISDSNRPGRTHTAGIAIPSSTGKQNTWPPSGRQTPLQQALLLCGIISALLYAAMLIIVPMFWQSYSSAAQTVSELSAIGAPSRSLWVALSRVWAVLYAAFGLGIWLTAGPNRALRVVGSTIILSNIVGLFWPPMHQREVLAAGGETLTDTLHIVWTAVNGVFTLMAMGFGAAALSKPFRHYSIATMVILLAAGALTSLQAPRVNTNLPTPWIGVWERINIGVWLLWVVLLAIMLWRRPLAQESP